MKSLLILTLCIASCLHSFAQTKAEAMEPEKRIIGGGGKKNPELRTNQKAIKAWQDARFGIYLTWGVTGLRGQEVGWTREMVIPKDEYDQLYKEFNPALFNAKEWARIFKDAGAKYAVYQTKHHDGFCMWPTKYTDYNIMNGPYGKDPTKRLAKACRRQGIIFGTYYSVCDWWHEDYLPRKHGGPGHILVDREPDFEKYYEYMKNQCRELVEMYDTDIFLFDGAWDETWSDDRGMDFYKYLRGLKDDVVISPRVGRGNLLWRKGTKTAEEIYPNSPGDYNESESVIGPYSTFPWQTWMVIGEQWNWKPNEKKKSLATLLRVLFVTAGRNGNLHLSIGPMPDGRIEMRDAARLREIGAWLEKYGESIYGTRGGPFSMGNDATIPGKSHGGKKYQFQNLHHEVPVTSTRKGNTIYLHVLRWPGETITLPNIDRKLVKHTVLTGGNATVTQVAAGIEISLPKEQHDELNTVIKLEFDRSVMEVQPVTMAMKNTMSDCKAMASGTFQGHPASLAFDGSLDTRWGGAEGSKSGWLGADLGAPKTFDRVWISEAYDRVRKFELQVKREGNWETIHTGTTLGADFNASFEPVTAQEVRLNILEATDVPTIWEFHVL